MVKHSMQALRRLRSIPISLLDRFESLTRTPLPNAVFVCCWLFIVVLGMGKDKPRLFEPSIHWTSGTPLVVRDADDVPRCGNNPTICKPFSFVSEWELWRRRLRN